MIKGLNHIVPLLHKDLDKWRDSLRHGLSIRFQDSNIILSGGVDDIWQDIKTGKLIIADYKSQANNKSLEPWAYLSDVYHEGYKIQMDFYGYLLSEMGHDVSDTFYFLICNANRKADGFFGKLDFEEVLVPYKWNAQWIPEKVSEMIGCMNSEEIPDPNVACKNCAYARQRGIVE